MLIVREVIILLPEVKDRKAVLVIKNQNHKPIIVHVAILVHLQQQVIEADLLAGVILLHQGVRAVVLVAIPHQVETQEVVGVIIVVVAMVVVVVLEVRQEAVEDHQEVVAEAVVKILDP